MTFFHHIRQSNLVRNLSANYLATAFFFLVGIWYTPYLLARLGKEAYSMIPLLGQLLAWVTIMVPAMSNYTSRSVLVAREQGDTVKANTIFNSALIIFLGLAFFSFALGMAMVVHLESVVNIPPTLITQAKWYAALLVVAASLKAVVAPYAIACYCRDRFDIASYLNMMQRALDVIVVVVIFEFIGASLAVIGIAAIVSSCCWAGRNIFISRRLLPEIHFSPKTHDRNEFQAMFSFTGWETLGAFFGFLGGMSELWVVNRFCGSLAGAIYAIALLLPQYVQIFSSACTGLFHPTLIRLYASGNIDDLVLRTNRSCKIIALLLALPVGGVLAFGNNFLQLWLARSDMSESDIAVAAKLACVIVWTVTLAAVNYPLGSIHTAAAKVKIPAVVTGVSNLLFFLIYLLAAQTVGPVGVVIAALVRRFFESVLFFGAYEAWLLRKPFWTFFKGTAFFCGLGLMTWAVGNLLSNWLQPVTWILMIVDIALTTALYSAFAWHLILSDDEKQLIRLKLCR